MLERSGKMNEVERETVANRCFGGKCPPDKPKDKIIKKVLTDASRRRRANREIDALLKQFKGRRIIDLLPAIERRCSTDVLKVAVERVERRRDELSLEDLMFFEGFKASLKEKGQS